MVEDGAKVEGAFGDGDGVGAEREGGSAVVTGMDLEAGAEGFVVGEVEVVEEISVVVGGEAGHLLEGFRGEGEAGGGGAAAVWLAAQPPLPIPLGELQHYRGEHVSRDCI